MIALSPWHDPNDTTAHHTLTNWDLATFPPDENPKACGWPYQVAPPTIHRTPESEDDSTQHRVPRRSDKGAARIRGPPGKPSQSNRKP